MNLRERHGEQGFTMIEIIAVLVLIGILSAVVVNNVGDLTSSNDLITEAEILKSNLRYAQIKAMNSSATEVWQISINAAKTAYTLQQYNGAAFEDRSLPGENEDLDGDGLYETHVLSGNILLKDQLDIVFNSWGIPVDDSNHANELIADLAVTLKKGATEKTITVTRNTGFTYLP